MREQSRGTPHSSFVSAWEESPQMALFTKRCNRSFVFMVRHFRVWDGVTAVVKRENPAVSVRYYIDMGLKPLCIEYERTHTLASLLCDRSKLVFVRFRWRQKLSVSRRLSSTKTVFSCNNLLIIIWLTYTKLILLWHLKIIWKLYLCTVINKSDY